MPARPVAGERPGPSRRPAREPAPDEGRIDMPVARWRLTGLLAAAVAFIAGIAFALVSGAGVIGENRSPAASGQRNAAIMSRSLSAVA